MSTQNCVDFASNGFIITGVVNLYRFKRDVILTPHNTAATGRPVIGVDSIAYPGTSPAGLVNATAFAAANPSWSGTKGAHIGSFVMSDAELHATATTGTAVLLLLSAPHTYHASILFIGMGVITSNKLA